MSHLEEPGWLGVGKGREGGKDSGSGGEFTHCWVYSCSHSAHGRVAWSECVPVVSIFHQLFQIILFVFRYDQSTSCQINRVQSNYCRATWAEGHLKTHPNWSSLTTSCWFEWKTKAKKASQSFYFWVPCSWYASTSSSSSLLFMNKTASKKQKERTEKREPSSSHLWSAHSKWVSGAAVALPVR